jgi:hypothetical protein
VVIFNSSIGRACGPFKSSISERFIHVQRSEGPSAIAIERHQHCREHCKSFQFSQSE